MEKQHVLTVLSAAVLLVLASVIGLSANTQIQNYTVLAWDGGWGGWGNEWSGWHGWPGSQWYQPVGCGGCNHQFGFGPWQTGYNAGYTDFSTNNGYDCGYDHSVVYCNGYLTKWNDAQNQNNQQTSTTRNQEQGQDQSSTAYSQSTCACSHKQCSPRCWQYRRRFRNRIPGS